MPCDASGMVEIHRYFRAGFGEASRLVRGVASGDRTHAEVVAGHLDALSKALHAHHEYEDRHFWDPLSSRAPGCALHVDRMRRQHAAMLAHLEALDAALPAWRLTALAGDAQPVQEALVGINEGLAEHLPDEEENIVPVMSEVFEPDDIAGASAHGRRATPKGYAFRSLGAILAAQPDGGEAWMRKNLPPPVRIVWKVLGRRRYEAHRAALLGQAR